MANRETAFIEITPEVLLKAYACGIFPMAESADDPALYWIEPEQRGIIPLDRFHMPSRLARTVRSDHFTVTVDRDFDAVLEGCAEPRPGRPRTWINGRIRMLYRKLYERRHCHSLEVYEGENLVGGLYGVTLGRAFFGESMFHRARDASKVALVHLVARLKAGGFRLLDTQFVTDHLRTFGAIEGFGLALGRHFLGERQVERATVSIREHAWLPIGAAPDAFTRDGSSTRTARVSVGRNGAEIRAGIADLAVMKTAHSAFAGFARLILPWDDRAYDEQMPLARIGYTELAYTDQANAACSEGNDCPP